MKDSNSFSFKVMALMLTLNTSNFCNPIMTGNVRVRDAAILSW